jgi:hypothetical protein
VNAKGLDDGPGPAAARYHALAHAALALAAATDSAGNPRESAALEVLATHARKHSVRLRATAEHAFPRSGQSGRYQGGRAQAEKGSQMIEKDYRTWIRTGSPLEAARDPQLWQHARRAEQAWHEVRRRGVADGPAAAATRYGELADAAEGLADGFTVTLPSSALPSLLELAEHARKHSMRLTATALAMAGTRSGHSTEDQRLADTDRSPGNARHDGLPDHLAAITRNAYASQHRQPQRPANPNNDHATIRNATTLRQNQQQDRSRGLALCRDTPLWTAIRICPVTRHELDAMAITVSARIWWSLRREICSDYLSTNSCADGLQDRVSLAGAPDTTHIRCRNHRDRDAYERRRAAWGRPSRTCAIRSHVSCNRFQRRCSRRRCLGADR